MALKSEEIPTCIPCSFRDTKADALYWCLVCKEGLCECCKKYHMTSKALKSHSLVTYENRGLLPEIALNVKEACSEHDRKLEVFCGDHQEPCCIKCHTIYHKNCNNVSPMDDVIKNVKSSVGTENLEVEINSLFSKIETVVEMKGNSVKNVEDHSKTLKKEVESLGIHLEEKLKIAVVKGCARIDEVKAQYDKKTSEVLSKLKEKLKVVSDLKLWLSQIIENGSNLQLFLCLKELELLVSKEQNSLSAIVASSELDNLELEYHPSDKVDSIFADGICSIVPKTTPIQLQANNLGQAAQSATTSEQTTLVNIDNITLENVKEILLPAGIMVTNCVVLHNESIIFVDFSDNMRLVLYDANFRFLRDIKMESNPFDVTLISDMVIAVTMPKKKMVFFVEFASNQDNVTKCIDTVGECYGIDQYENQLFIAVKGYGIQISGIDGTFIKTIQLACTVLLVLKSGISFVDVGSNILRCCDYHGRHMWELEFPVSFSDYPSLEKDKNENIFIADKSSDDFFIVSKDRSKFRKLLQRSDGLYNINGLHYNIRKHQLLVCTNSETSAVLYDVSF